MRQVRPKFEAASTAEPKASGFRGGVRIPRTSARNAQNVFAKLLERVRPAAVNGFQFEGTIVKPGGELTQAALRPTPSYPAVPILLEAAGVQMDHSVFPRPRHGDHLYILWRFVESRNDWEEIGRARCASWQWASELGPIAGRAIAESLPPEPFVTAQDLDEAAGRIGAVIDREISALGSLDKVRIMAVLHDRLACQVAGLSE